MAITKESVLRDQGSVSNGEWSVGGLRAEILDGALTGYSEVAARIELRHRCNGGDRRRVFDPEGTSNVFGVHADFTKPSRGVSGRRRAAGNDVPEPLESLVGVRPPVLGQTPLVVYVEIESGTDDAGQPA